MQQSWRRSRWCASSTDSDDGVDLLPRHAAQDGLEEAASGRGETEGVLGR